MTSLIRIILIAGLTAPAVAQDPEALLNEANCRGCHQAEQPMLGPAYQAVAQRYRGEDSAEDTIFRRMREGSKGIWGEAPMPPVTEDTLTDKELRVVIEWILSR